MKYHEVYDFADELNPGSLDSRFFAFLKEKQPFGVVPPSGSFKHREVREKEIAQQMDRSTMWLGRRCAGSCT